MFVSVARLELNGTMVIIGFTVIIDEDDQGNWRGSFDVSIAEHPLRTGEAYAMILNDSRHGDIVIESVGEGAMRQSVKFVGRGLLT